MSYRPPARSRGESAISKRRNARRQEQARLVALLLLLGLGIAVLVAIVLGIRSCAVNSSTQRPEAPRRGATQGGASKSGATKGGATAPETPPAGKPADKLDPKAAAKKAASGLKQLSKRRFKPAPFAMMHDGKTLFCAQDTPGLRLFGAGQKTHPDLYQLDSLSAWPLAGGKRIWEAALEASFSELGLAAGNVVLFNPYETYYMKDSSRQRADPLQPPPNLGLMLAAFDSADGRLAWSQSIAGAVDAKVSMDSKAVVVAYRDSLFTEPPSAVSAAPGAEASMTQQLASQLRLVAFNAKSGQKAWSREPALKSLQTDQLDQAGAQLELNLLSWEGLSAYTCYNIVGLIQSGSGDPILTYTAPGYIYATAYDVTVKTFYVLHAGSRPGQYELTALLIGGKGKPKEKPVGSFEAGSEHFLLLAEGGFVAVALQTGVSAGQKQQAEERSAGQQLTTRLLSWRSGSQTALLSHQFASGEAIDLASVPGVAGEFLIALAGGLDAQGQPRGAGSLYRARSQDGSVWEVTARKEPVTWLLPYKTECLLLYKGGQIQRYIPESNSCIDLARGTYDFVEPTPGRSRTPAVLSSYPLGYLQGKSGQQMQVLAFE